MSTTIIEVDPTTLRHLPTTNPNVMDPSTFEGLVAGIEVDGFLQPVLIVEEDGEHVIIDGVHRTQAAVKIGLPTIPAVLAPDRGRAEILRLALNRMRGELDLSEVSKQMQFLLDEGYTNEELTLTGFASWEIDALLDSTIDGDELTGADTTPIAPEKPKTYSLNIRFESESHRARIREALEDLGDGNIIEGVEAALDSAAPDWRG
jgi:hypothetical protein